MQQQLKSEGKCLFCNQLFSQKEITKHLETHLAAMEKQDAGKVTSAYHHIIVETGEMFLNILLAREQKMKVIDDFLKKIWLDCCGHLSNFEHKNFKIGMNNTVKDVFQPKIKVLHHYDYGTTTTVALRSGKVFDLPLKDKLILLSRNEPLKLMCSTCKTQPAQSICTACNYEEFLFFCEKCSQLHAQTCEDFEDYANMPVVNSPRMGECGYTGGNTDIERDGAYKSEN